MQQSSRMLAWRRCLARRQLVGVQGLQTDVALGAVIGLQVVVIQPLLFLCAEGTYIRPPTAVPFSIRVEWIGIGSAQQSCAALWSRALVLA